LNDPAILFAAALVTARRADRRDLSRSAARSISSVTAPFLPPPGALGLVEPSMDRRRGDDPCGGDGIRIGDIAGLVLFPA
jgi:hypothetical protein